MRQTLAHDVWVVKDDYGETFTVSWVPTRKIHGQEMQIAIFENDVDGSLDFQNFGTSEDSLTLFEELEPTTTEKSNVLKMCRNRKCRERYNLIFKNCSDRSLKLYWKKFNGGLRHFANLDPRPDNYCYK